MSQNDKDKEEKEVDLPMVEIPLPLLLMLLDKADIEFGIGTRVELAEKRKGDLN